MGNLKEMLIYLDNQIVINELKEDYSIVFSFNICIFEMNDGLIDGI